MHTSRWPHIQQYLHVRATGQIDDTFYWWQFHTERITLPNPDVAAAYDEWADFYEWCLSQRAGELAADRVKRHQAEEWTADMAYCCRRSVAWARGEDPGEWRSLVERRPDIRAEPHTIVSGKDSGPDQPAGCLVPVG
jgi:hypothetical protein